MSVLEELNGSKAVNEYTILCGRCKKQKIVPTGRSLKARAEYFKKSMSFFCFIILFPHQNVFQLFNFPFLNCRKFH